MIYRTQSTYKIPQNSLINGNSLLEPPSDIQIACFGMGCFWGVERLFYKLKGVVTTSVGYCGGDIPYPTYEEVCQGNTNHAEVVRVFFNPKEICYLQLLSQFWENHDPTQGMRQGNDIGTQYRSIIVCYDEQQVLEANQSKLKYQDKLIHSNINQQITTEIVLAQDNPYYLAEEYHQQYLFKNPNGYCGLKGTGVCFI